MPRSPKTTPHKVTVVDHDPEDDVSVAVDYLRKTEIFRHLGYDALDQTAENLNLPLRDADPGTRVVKNSW